MSGRVELLFDLALSAGIEVAGNGAVLGCGGSWRWCGTFDLQANTWCPVELRARSRFEPQATNDQPQRGDQLSDIVPSHYLIDRRRTGFPQ